MDATFTPLLLTAEDVGRLLQISVQAVHHLHKCKRLLGSQVGKDLKWHPADVRAFADSLRTTGGTR